MADGAVNGFAGARLRIPDHVVYREFAHETVLLNLATGRYHGLNPSGGRILASIEKAGDFKEATAALAQAYGQPAADVERDVHSFCADLIARGLIEVEPAEAQ